MTTGQFTASFQKYTLNFKKPAGTSRGFLRRKTVWFLRLTDRVNPARVGLGECALWQGLSLDDRPDFEAKLADVCTAINKGASPLGFNLAEFPALAFGLEMALLDWRGGGVRRLFDTPFSRGETSLPTHGLLWMDTAEGVLAQARAKVEAGFSCLKMKIGALDFETECDILAQLRREFPAVEIRLDANGAFTPHNALNRLKMLAQFNIAAVEQPLKPGQWFEMAALCAQSPIPIALDEELMGHYPATEKNRLLETIRPHRIVLKPALLGGFSAAEDWITLAGTLDIDWWINSALESNIGLNALCQWVSAIDPATVHGLGTGQLYANNVPSPLKLNGAGLKLDPNSAWETKEIFDF